MKARLVLRWTFHPAAKFVIAITAGSAIYLASVGFFAFAGIALAATIFLVMWRWRSLTTNNRTWRLRSRAALGRFAGGSVLLTLLALSLWRAGLLHGPGEPRLAAFQPAPRMGAENSVGGEGYHGIILLPPEEKKLPEIWLPRDRSPLSRMAGAHQPLIIRFDGPYWYLKPPNNQPGRDAHLAHGRSTDVNVRSTDAMPVLMQAHQVLSEEIPLTCCSDVVLNVTNAEIRPGEIVLAVVLTDNSTSPEHSIYLGQKTLPGTELQHAGFRSPLEESLRFAIPSSARLAHFNQIDVMFVPSRARARTGAKIALNTFTLIPR